MNANRFALAAIAAVLCVEACDALSAPTHECVVTESTHNLGTGTSVVRVRGEIPVTEVAQGIYRSAAYDSVALENTVYVIEANRRNGFFIAATDLVTQTTSQAPGYLRLVRAHEEGGRTIYDVLEIDCQKATLR